MHVEDHTGETAKARFNPEDTNENTQMDSSGSLLEDIGGLSGLGDITYKSFVCLGGEVQLSDALAPADVTQAIPLDYNSHSLCADSELEEGSESFQEGEPHFDHPYCQDERGMMASSDVSIVAPTVTYVSASTDSLSASHPSTTDIGDITYKSFVCSGVEIEVSGTPDNTSELSALLKNLMVEDHQALSQSHAVFDESQDVLLRNSQHEEHPYCNLERNTTMEPAADLGHEMFHNLDQAKEDLDLQMHSGGHDENFPRVEEENVDAGLSGGQIEDITFKSFVCMGGEVEVLEDASIVSKKSAVIVEGSMLENSQSSVNVTVHEGESSGTVLPGEGHVDHPYCEIQMSFGGDVPVAGVSLEIPVVSDKTLDEESDGAQIVSEDPKTTSVHGEDSAVLSYVHDGSTCASDVSTKSSAPVTQDDVATASPASSQNAPPESSSAGPDSALGSSGHPLQASESDAEEMRRESPLPVLDELPSAPSSQQLSAPCTPKASFLCRSILLDPGADEQDSRLWAEALDSPLPPPRLNSTALPTSLLSLSVPPSPSPSLLPLASAPALAQPLPAAPEAAVAPAVCAPPHLDPGAAQAAMFGSGPLQEQLRQMAELLIAASGNMAPRPAAVERRHVEVATSPMKLQSVSMGVCTSPVRCVEHSMNTSVPPVVEVPVADVSTSTDSLLWK